MKYRILTITFLLSMITGSLLAQLPDGSTVPDFTFTDINGVVRNLYSYLNDGKIVAIDISATWCHPCWLYHESHSMDSLYMKHDDPGDQRWKVLFIEGDGGTDSADLHGVGTSTVGDWVTGTSFPIIDPAYGVILNDFKAGYNVNFFPTLYLICTNKKAYQDTLNKGDKPFIETWEYLASAKCGPAGIDDLKDDNPVTVYPNPAHGQTTLYFSLNAPTRLLLNLLSVTGIVVAKINTEKLVAGDHSFKFDLEQYLPGMYLLEIADTNGRTIRKKLVIQ